MNYAGFGKRLGASFIDALVLLPVTIGYFLLYKQSRNFVLIFTILAPLITLAYTIVFHALWGQTLGKRAVHIRVVKVSGEAIAWREAFLRSLGDIVFNTLGAIGMLVALLHFPEAEYAPLDWRERYRHIFELRPMWDYWTSNLSLLWFWSEFVVLLFNKKKRALHDFMAGTLVIQEQPAALEKALS
jgi:uncharacterized RDD family membrane protein YckC